MKNEWTLTEESDGTVRVVKAEGGNDPKLRAALLELQEAAWSRSWSRLRKARDKIFRVTGVRLTGRLEAMQQEQH
jgi:hypothetical protein